MGSLLRLGGIAVLALILGGLAYVLVQSSRAEARVQAKLAALRAAGEPTTWKELLSEPIPPANNAAALLRKMRGELEAVERETSAIYDGASKSDQAEFDQGRGGPLVKQVSRILADNATVLAEIAKASERPEFVILDRQNVKEETIDEELIDILQQCRTPIRILSSHVRVLAAEGKWSEALDDCLTTLRLARHLDQQPTTIGFMVALASRGAAVESTNIVLRGGPLSAEQHDALEAELARPDLPAAHVQSLRSERVFGTRQFDALITPLGFLNFGLKQDFAGYLETFDTLLVAVEKPYWDKGARQDVQLAFMGGGTLTQLVAPASSAVLEGRARTQSQLNCLRVLNALTRPDAPSADDVDLSRLNLPNDAKTDPFTGKPLLLHHVPEGWVIYSVGKDDKDDGGELVNDDVGLGPPALSAAPDETPESEAPVTERVEQ